MCKPYKYLKEVTAALIIEGNKLLIARRAPNQKLSGLWEFPGGKLEPGETAEECLVREIKEELSIDIAVNGYVGHSIFEYETGTIKLLAFRCHILGGKVQLSVHSEIAWVDKDNISDFDFAPADLPFVDMILDGSHRL